MFNSTEGEWYLGKVVPLVSGETGFQAMKVDGDDAGEGGDEAAMGGRDGAGMKVRIHYQGWPNK